MLEKEKIVQLHNQGYCTGYISIRLGVSSDDVRAVVSQASTSAAVRRAKAENKRVKALRLLAEAEQALRP
jgi:orotate phosphoribosyltransferase-like protein